MSDIATEDFRAMLARMEAQGHVTRMKKPVKPQHFSALCTKAPGVLLARKSKATTSP